MMNTAGVARSVLDSLLQGCQVIGFDYSYLYVNETVARQGGRPMAELLGRTMEECYPGIEKTAFFGELRRCMAERSHHRMENEFTFPDGSVGWFELEFLPVPEGICILSVDITEKKRAEAELARSQSQLFQAQKMDAVGRLAGGVAHDFNNILSVIMSYSSMALEQLPPGDPLLADIREIEKAGAKARDLTRQLLAFTRHQPPHQKLINLTESLTGLTNMLRRVLGEDIELRIVLPQDLMLVKADPAQIEQIVVNLAVNARDAMPGGGTLTIEGSNVELDEDYTREHLGTQPGAHVMLAASDTGIGMDKATQSRIFEPFFTTKELGKGTGLGLSTVFGIVRQSGGSIWVYSEPGIGTTFKIYFPVAEPLPTRSSATPPGGRPSRFNETILIVEDDEPLRRLTMSILQRQGYSMLVAAEPAQALEITERHPAVIDLLLTDVMMPHMNGKQLAARVRALRPQVKVLYMSGYTGEVVVQHGVLEQNASFIQKPITPDALTRAVRKALDNGSPPALLEARQA